MGSKAACWLLFLERRKDFRRCGQMTNAGVGLGNEAIHKTGMIVLGTPVEVRRVILLAFNHLEMIGLRT